jgi:hypothetical protein
MHVEDIESTIKELVLLAYTSEDDVVDEKKLTEAISKVDYQSPKNVKQKTYDDLSMGHYISLLLFKQTWDVFEPIFQLSRDAVRNILESVRDTRNDLAHFRSELNPEQIDQLGFCAGWLARQWESYQKQLEISRKQSFGVNKPDQQGEIIREAASTYEVSIEKVDEVGNLIDLKKDDLAIIAEEKQPSDSRYAPLADWLQSQLGEIDRVKFSFEEVEDIIGGKLPTSAYNHRAWWANDSVGHPHSKLWLEAGWRRSSLNMSENKVTFVRIREREKAYIDFYNKLVASLLKEANFPIREISPDGQSWIVCQSINSPGFNVALFVFSFSRGRRFRVELYIDTGKKETTKQLYDLINSQKSVLAVYLGDISWERIDDKRASRIALYHSGAITDSEAELEILKSWAVEKMVWFYKTIEPVASRAALEVLGDG